MKFPESWLREFVRSPLSGDALADVLTMAGLESEELHAAAPPFSGVVVARVLSAAKHPDADRLNVCQVDVGEAAPVQIVCGAPNVAAGMTVPCARPGALLPGDFKIKVAKVRGIESLGMLCSAKELGLSEDAAGLLPLPDTLMPGADFRSALDLDDQIHLLKLTPNRGDCLSVLGLAREVSALTGAVLQQPPVDHAPVTAQDQRPVQLDAPAACPRYLGRIIDGVDARAQTPDWMVRRLERCGLRSISALVDITNYVMLELGQPLHAFDDAKLSGSVHARMAQAGDQLLLLNGQTIAIDPDVLVIADDEKVLAMAGIMGGEDSGITLDTTRVFLESAFFAPEAIAGRARRYGFSSDASHRFERGVDFDGARRALERASRLVLQICGGRAAPVSEATATLPTRAEVALRSARLNALLGVTISPDEVEGYLRRLGLGVRLDDGCFWVQPPSHRFDLCIEEDLVEEVVRLYGYNRVPTRPPRASLAMLPETELARTRRSVRQTIAVRGYQEVVNYAFVDAQWERDFAGNDYPIALANPIASQMGVMRSSLMGGLVANLITNQKRKQSRVRLFEVGRCFARSTDAAEPVRGFAQPWHVAGLAWGSADQEQWGEVARKVDFFDVKGDLMAVLPTGCNFSAVKHPALHPGRAAEIRCNGKSVGLIGELHPRWVQSYDLATAPVVFELFLEPLLASKVPAFEAVSKQPMVARDLALVVDVAMSCHSILDAMQSSRPSWVRSIELFDLYQGKGVPEGKKSLAFRIVMQDTQKTLQDSEVELALQEWVRVLGEKTGAVLRA